uniref:RNA-directed DNA polymerase n=1 Tax=Strongyloides venezuelensis TaxID=75913 RepID=A0A0K0FBD6_STRVS
MMEMLVFINGDERLNIELATFELPQRIRPGRRSREIEIDKQVENMLEKGMIEPSRSPYLSRVVLVRKKDMKWRFVVDFRAINKLIKQQSHLIPRIDRLTEEASDDILTCSQDEKSHIRNIDNILARIAKYNMKITLNKCQFGRKNAQYLGYIIDFDSIHLNPDKVKAITDKREPKTEKKIKSFLAEPLYRVINSYSWTSAQSDAFQALKKALINAAVLAPPDHTASYTIYTNASFQGLGAALTQKNKSIAFASRSLKPAEKNNPIIKLEVLALVHALQQFRPYIYGKHAKVVTDYKPLLALLKNKELTGILQRYQMAIMEYDITIVYLKGEDNHVADYLSRTEFNAILLNEGLFEEVFPKNEESNDYSICYRGKRRVLVPKVLREELLRRFHSYPLLGQHFGFDKIADKFCLIFFWPKMLEDMKRIWQNCEVCWKVKHQPTNLAATNTKTIPKPEGIWETLNADYIQLDDHLHVLVIIDEYSPDTFSDEIAVNLSLSGLKDIIQFGRTEFDESQPKRKGKVLSPSMFVMKRVLHKKLNHTSHKNQDIFEGSYKIIKHLHAYTYIIQKCSRTGRKERVTTDRLKVLSSLYITSNNT